MRYIFIISAILAAYLAASSPISLEPWAEGYPGGDVLARAPRADAPVKEGSDRVFGRPLELGLRKGEYICGNRVCKLKPGEKPPCSICQYPV